MGTRYYVLVFDDQSDGGGNGGTLSIRFGLSVLPDLAFSVDGFGRLDPHSGRITLSGSISCSPGADFTVFVDASQKRGRSTVTGSGVAEGVCDGTTQRWTAEVAPENSTFKGGKVETVSFGVASNADGGRGEEIVQTVKLRRGR